MIGSGIGDAFNTTMRHVSTGIQLVRGLSVQGLAESFDATTLFNKSSVDLSGTDLSGLDLSGIDLSGTILSGTRIDSKPKQSTYSKARSIAYTALGYLLTILICSFVANDMIYLPWFVRLFAFIFVFLSSYIHPLLFIGIALYYITLGMYNAMTGADRILPRIYTLLPLRVARGNGFDRLFAPFTYLYQGSEGSFYNNLKAGQATYMANLIAAFPDYESLKATFSLEPLIKNVDNYMTNLNASDYIPMVVPTQSA